LRDHALFDADAARSYPAFSLQVPASRAQAVMTWFLPLVFFSIAPVNRKVDGTFTDLIQ
jgi:hypothetical protein